MRGMIRHGLKPRSSKYQYVIANQYKQGQRYVDYDGGGVEKDQNTDKLAEMGYLELIGKGKLPKAFTRVRDDYTER